MAILYQDFSEREKQRMAVDDAKQVEQNRLAQMVGVAMSGLKGDPKWVTYADHIAALKERAVASSDALKQEILEDRTVVGDTLASKRLELSYQQGRIKGLTEVLNLIKILVDRGEQGYILQDTGGSNNAS
jgi:hypothetical protein